MSLCCTIDIGARLVCRYLPILLFPLYQERVRPLSELLQQYEPRPESSLDAIEIIYANQGWKRPRDRLPVNTEPSLVAPHLPYSTHYEMMGVTVTSLERLIQEFVPYFSLQSIMLRLCEELESPSTDEAFPLVVEPGVAEEEEEKEAVRVIPVFSLPLVLSQFPECYQRGTNTLQECERLRGVLIGRANHIQLTRQLALMDTNRHYLAFIQQQALHYNQVPLARRDAERMLFEQDLTALVHQQLRQAEATAAHQRKVRRQLRKLCQKGDH
jgi:hypothetical protein